MKIFLDTNIVYKLYRAYILAEGVLHFSQIKKSEHTFVISTQVLYELEQICKRRRKKLSISMIRDFIVYMEFQLIKPSCTYQKYEIFVHDKPDAKILADCIKAKAKYLLTKNIKDFRVMKIRKELHVFVIDVLPR